MKSFHSNPEVSKGVEEDGAGCGDCSDCKDAPDSPRSTDGPRVDGSLPVQALLTHLAVDLCILNKKSAVPKSRRSLSYWWTKSSTFPISASTSTALTSVFAFLKMSPSRPSRSIAVCRISSFALFFLYRSPLNVLVQRYPLLWNAQCYSTLLVRNNSTSSIHWNYLCLDFHLIYCLEKCFHTFFGELLFPKLAFVHHLPVLPILLRHGSPELSLQELPVFNHEPYFSHESCHQILFPGPIHRNPAWSSGSTSFCTSQFISHTTTDHPSVARQCSPFLREYRSS